MKKIVLLAIVILAALGWWWRGRARQEDAGSGRAEIVVPVRTNLLVAIESTAVVEPRNRLEIKPTTAGRIEDVLVVEGQAVERGDVLAWMSSIERATLLDAARAKGEETARKWEDIYRATPLTAPLASTVIARATEPGQTVGATDVVLVLSDRLILRAQVDETDIGRVRTGMTARVRLDAYTGSEMMAVVRHIAYEATTVNNVTIYEVEVEPESIPSFMRSGMTATVSFEVESSGSTWALPIDALRWENDEARVRVALDPEGRMAEDRPVTTGLSAGGWVAIASGLQGDERVIKSAFRLPDAKPTSGSPFVPGRPSGMHPRR